MRTFSKYLIAFAVALITLAALTRLAILEFREWQDRSQVVTGCSSDALSPIGLDFQIYAEKHSGHFCDPSRVTEMLYQEDHTNFLYCLKSKQQFIWNPKLAQIPLDSPTKRMLAWCPPGSHGRYVGVITVLQRRVTSELMTVEELHKMTNSESL